MKKLELSGLMLGIENMLTSNEKRMVKGGWCHEECICMTGNYSAPCGVSCADEFCPQVDGW